MQIEYSASYPYAPLAEKIIRDWRSSADAFELMSSGSTGSPQTICLERKLLQWSAELTKMALGNQSYTQAIVLPLNKTGGFMQLIRSLHLNWDCHLYSPQADALAPLSEAISEDLISLTPHQLMVSVELHAERLAQFKTVLIGGAAVSGNLEARILNDPRFEKTSFFATYGMTETASHIALRPFGDSYYKALPGVEMQETDQGTTIKIPEVGLSIQSADLIQGDATSFQVVGRLDDVINSGGIKIHPNLLEQEIAPLLEQMGILRSFFVYSKPDPILGQGVMLVLEGEPLQDESFVLEFLKRALPVHRNPKSIHYLARIKRTDTGKIIRRIETA